MKLYKYKTVGDRLKGAFLINGLYWIGDLFNSKSLIMKADYMGEMLIAKLVDEQPYGTCRFSFKGIETWKRGDV